MNLPRKRFKDTQTCYFNQELRSFMSSEDSWDSFLIGVTTKIPVLGQDLTWTHGTLAWQELEALETLQVGGSRGRQSAPGNVSWVYQKTNFGNVHHKDFACALSCIWVLCPFTGPGILLVACRGKRVVRPAPGWAPGLLPSALGSH